jgi:hypothetical protein
MVRSRAMRVSSLALIPIALAVWAQAPRQDGNGRLRFAISFPSARSAQPIDGRVLLFISDDGRTEPRTQPISIAPTRRGPSSASTSTRFVRDRRS